MGADAAAIAASWAHEGPSTQRGIVAAAYLELLAAPAGEAEAAALERAAMPLVGSDGRPILPESAVAVLAQRHLALTEELVELLEGHDNLVAHLERNARWRLDVETELGELQGLIDYVGAKLPPPPKPPTKAEQARADKARAAELEAEAKRAQEAPPDAQ